MKTNRKLLVPWVVILCSTLVLEAKAGDPASDPLCFQDQTIGCDAESSAGIPPKFNRASGIVGMEVRNRNNEHLGRLKDVVFDLSTERVSYAVISAKGGRLSASGRKLLAVPLNALAASDDGKHLLLEAEKSKVKTAMGFDRNHWPDVISPSWGAEPCWQESATQLELRDQPAESRVDMADTGMKREQRGTPPNVSSERHEMPGDLAWPGW